MKYALLKTTNPEYDLELYNEIEDLYEGGYKILDNAAKYLPRLAQESDPIYRDRLRSSSYLPYMGQIVDQLSAQLFSEELTITASPDAENDDTPGEVPEGYYQQFMLNADRSGRSFADVMQGAAREAMKKGRAFVGVDFPRLDQAMRETIATRADEENLGATDAYLYDVAPEEVTDWEYDDDGRLMWALVYRCFSRRRSLIESRDRIVEQYKYWYLTDSGTASWQIYEVEYAADGKDKPKDDDDIPLADEGDTTFPEIPLIEIRAPKGLWVGNKIGPLAREFYQRRSAFIASQAKSLVAIPVAQLGPEIEGAGGELPSDAQQNPYRGHDPVGQFRSKGFVVVGKDDKIGFAETAGTSFKIVQEELKDLREEMFRVVHMMAASVNNRQAATVGRSGLSKQSDKEDTAIVLTAWGTLVRGLAERAMNLIARALGDSIVWHARGLDSYETVDRPEVLQEAISVDQVGIPSKTFKVAYKTALALKLAPGLPETDQEQIRQEISTGVDAEAEMQDVMREATIAGAQQPEPEPNQEPGA